MAEEVKLTYVQEQVTRALLSLMEQYPFEEITVTQVVRCAGVGRASFYRHYKSTGDVIRYYMTVLIRQWGREFEAAGDPDWALSLLRHYYGQRDFYMLLYRCGLSHHMLAIIRETVGVEAETQNVPAYMKAWFAGALFGWIEEWIRRGMRETPEQMQELLRQYSKKKSRRF
ncbi:MAG: TetR/AcrR family transcriptional regulator C-terminal domain-containing protein [Oscillospiraceae bacterium]